MVPWWSRPLDDMNAGRYAPVAQARKRGAGQSCHSSLLFCFPAVKLGGMSNRDVMKALRDELKCAAFELDDVDGRIGYVNFCDTHGASR